MLLKDIIIFLMDSFNLSDERPIFWSRSVKKTPPDAMSDEFEIFNYPMKFDMFAKGIIDIYSRVWNKRALWNKRIPWKIWQDK